MGLAFSRELQGFIETMLVYPNSSLPLQSGFDLPRFVNFWFNFLFVCLFGWAAVRAHVRLFGGNERFKQFDRLLAQQVFLDILFVFICL